MEGLYRVFARYPKPAVIESCPCGCTPADATSHLVAVPLRELRFADMADFAFSAMTTQGSVDDFRYLLPRLFEGVTQESSVVSLEILFGKLKYAKWLSWPDDEINAVRDYLRELWLAGLTGFPIEGRLPSVFEIETLLASIASAGDDLHPYLRLWTDTEVTEADENLIQFVTMFGSSFSNGATFHDAFWKDAQPQAELLRAWLLMPTTLDRIAAAAHLLRQDGFEHLFEPAFEALKKESRAQ